MKYTNRALTKTDWQERCGKKQKEKIREYDRKRAAETRLKKKMEQESIRGKSQKRSKKYRDSKEIPTTSEKFQKFVTKVCNVAKEFSEKNEDYYRHNGYT